MLASSFKLTGDKELDRTFAGLPKAVQRRVLSKALRSTAKIYQRAIQAESPHVSGELSRSFKVRAAKSRAKGVVKIQARSLATEYKGDQFYGAFVHFGHRLGKRTFRVSKKPVKKKRRRKLVVRTDTRPIVPENPFVKRASAAVDSAARQHALSIIREGIEQVAAK